MNENETRSSQQTTYIKYKFVWMKSFYTVQVDVDDEEEKEKNSALELNFFFNLML